MRVLCPIFLSGLVCVCVGYRGLAVREPKLGSGNERCQIGRHCSCSHSIVHLLQFILQSNAANIRVALKEFYPLIWIYCFFLLWKYSIVNIGRNFHSIQSRMCCAHFPRYKSLNKCRPIWCANKSIESVGKQNCHTFVSFCLVLCCLIGRNSLALVECRCFQGESNKNTRYYQFNEPRKMSWSQCYIHLMSTSMHMNVRVAERLHPLQMTLERRHDYPFHAMPSMGPPFSVSSAAQRGF